MMFINKKLKSKIIMITVFSIILFIPLIATSNNLGSGFSSINELGLNQSKQINLELTLPSELENFLDSIIPAQLANYSIAGATFSMVKDGSIFLEKGYGYANSADHTPVLANETMFRIGSISKTFTAIAVLQLVETGLLDLDVDINNYLSAFKIPETYEEPITLRHLLTHTAGFEKADIYTILPYAQDFEQVLAEGIPDRVRPPNIISSYSNYGFALAGYIVQEVSGKNFEQYVSDEILAPIGMNSSSFLQPLPSNLSSQMSTGYDKYNLPRYFEYISIPPAGSGSSTASDMSKFMIALLNNGSYDGNQILEKTSVDMMLSNQFLTHENLAGIGLGLYEFDLSNQRIIGHGGDTQFFHSRMMLFPELNIGVFASYNSEGGSVARTELFNEFIEEYFPYPKVDIEPLQGYKRRARRFTGFFVASRRVYSDKTLFDERDFIDVSFTITTKKGHLIVEGISGLEFVEVEPNYFIESTGEYYFEIAFIQDKRGRITHFYTNFIGPHYAFEKTHTLYFGSEYQTAMVATILILMFISLAYWGIRALVGFFKKKEKNPKIQSIARWSFLISTSLVLVTALVTPSKINNDILLVIETVKVFNGLLVFPFLYLLTVIVQIVFTFFAWTGVKNEEGKPYWKLSGRVHYSILVLLSIIMIGIFTSWQFYII